MALYPNTPFVEGQVVTPDLFYTAFNPDFDDQTQYLGHLARLTDDKLSNLPGNIKSRLAAVTDNFKVVSGAGLTVTHSGGSLINNNDFVNIVPGSVAVPATGNYYVFIDKNNVVRAAATMPAVRIMLSYVTTNATSVLNVFDLRSGGGFPVISPNLASLVTFGGGGEDGAYNAVNGQVLNQGEYNFSSFNVPAGVAISISQFAKIRVSGSTVIAGTVTVVVPAIPSGGIFNLVSGMSISGAANRGLGSKTGESPANTYSPTQQPSGSDGCNGTVVCSGANNVSVTVTAAAGGSGGGGLIIDSAGAILVTATGIIRCDGLDGASSSYGVDLGGARTFKGAGSGGSGGYISLKSLDRVVVAGTLSAKGGNGGSGYTGNSSWAAENGNGGGGGVFNIVSPTIDIQGTANFTILGGFAGGTLPPDYSFGSAIAINTPGGSFGGLGGTAADVTGVAGGAGYSITRSIAPSPS